MALEDREIPLATMLILFVTLCGNIFWLSAICKLKSIKFRISVRIWSMRTILWANSQTLSSLCLSFMVTLLMNLTTSFPPYQLIRYFSKFNLTVPLYLLVLIQDVVILHILLQNSWHPSPKIRKAPCCAGCTSTDWTLHFFLPQLPSTFLQNSCSICFFFLHICTLAKHSTRIL